MEAYVYRNLNSYKSIEKKLKDIMNPEEIMYSEGCFLINNDVDVDISKRYTSIVVKNPSYNISELRKIVLGR